MILHTQKVVYYALITARCYASAVLATALCLSVCLSVRPSQVGVLLKRLNVESRKQHRTIARECQRSLRNSTGITPCGAPNTGGAGQKRRLSTNSWLYLENGTR